MTFGALAVAFGLVVLLLRSGGRALGLLLALGVILFCAAYVVGCGFRAGLG